MPKVNQHQFKKCITQYLKNTTNKYLSTTSVTKIRKSLTIIFHIMINTKFNSYFKGFFNFQQNCKNKNKNLHNYKNAISNSLICWSLQVNPMLNATNNLSNKFKEKSTIFKLKNNSLKVTSNLLIVIKNNLNNFIIWKWKLSLLMKVKK